MAVTWKGFYDHGLPAIANDTTIDVDIATNFLDSSLISSSPTGESYAAGDLLVCVVTNKFRGTGAANFDDLLSYPSDSWTLSYQVRIHDDCNVHIFYRWATASESDYEFHFDTSPGDGSGALTHCFSGLKGSGDPFSEVGWQTKETAFGQTIANGGQWDPNISVTVPANNGGVIFAFPFTMDDDATNGITLNTARGFTSNGSKRSQITTNAGMIGVNYRIVSNSDAGSELLAPEFTQTTGSAEEMAVIYGLTLFAGPSRTKGYRYDLMSMSSAAKYRAYGGGLTPATGGTASGGTPVTSGAPPPPIDYTQAVTPVTDHGALTGLSDDDHTLYTLVDGTRAFTGTVGGITPVSSSDLATKGYVDTNAAGQYEVIVYDDGSGLEAVATEAGDDWLYYDVS